MIRALIAAVLLTGVAVHFFGAPEDAALGYSLLLCATLWFTWPAARVVAGLIRRTRRRRHPRRAPAKPASPGPHLTQINHHHHYYGGPPMATPATTLRPDYSLPALPERSSQQLAHDAIYNTIDIDL
ncbi:hypothetical protein K883_05290 [Mycobacterium sp. TKK-01-0059]|uniref:hypothetical protein n=1 Tax=Mycobacterium sp. TKK-01-0059 TaxID=1324269 RepID=UPI0004D3F954|nr:hypothetical protein [Mycobacterium sp. TKK-01-0059]KEF94866.1 hypothetical protein K883_05290 [Mycobacterium sp. TKK-01-0059]